ncbi:hypothetical protein BKD30_11325 [Tersicoccus phoenicis]|uniref:Flagellar hook-length control protein-like C-terminal domain-containing protein n=1 Tax=Tersicoccus phoenicis TaxID=554083 RepID=A0A1R1L7K9_9MICC|nr:flagellar hook-length control protein FliK [Tersicoccus phoenicis]OMH23520.1 hypothetical protein BKD30_11325 [Tersicoccus phoenicis]
MSVPTTRPSTPKLPPTATDATPGSATGTTDGRSGAAGEATSGRRFAARLHDVLGGAPDAAPVAAAGVRLSGAPRSADPGAFPRGPLRSLPVTVPATMTPAGLATGPGAAADRAEVASDGGQPVDTVAAVSTDTVAGIAPGTVGDPAGALPGIAVVPGTGGATPPVGSTSRGQTVPQADAALAGAPVPSLAPGSSSARPTGGTAVEPTPAGVAVPVTTPPSARSTTGGDAAGRVTTGGDRPPVASTDPARAGAAPVLADGASDSTTPGGPARPVNWSTGPATSVAPGAPAVTAGPAGVGAPVTAPGASASAVPAAPDAGARPVAGTGESASAGPSATAVPVIGAPVIGAPVIGSAVAGSGTAPSTPAPLPSGDPLLYAQLGRALGALRTAGEGRHELTVAVHPDDLGPVTVRARIEGGTVRIELFAPTDAGRDAVRSALADLRRTLAETGLTADLDLSDRSAPQDGWGSRPDVPDDDSGRAGGTGRAAAATEPTPTGTPLTGRARGRLDVLA